MLFGATACPSVCSQHLGPSAKSPSAIALTVRNNWIIHAGIRGHLADSAAI